MHPHSQGLGGHWQRVAFCVLVDVALVWLSFGLGMWLRFGAVTWDKFAGYALGIAAASVILPAILYVGGLYSRRGTSEFSKIGQLRWLLLGLIGAGLADLGMGSIDFSARIGRGVFGIAMPLLAAIFSAVAATAMRCVWWQSRGMRSESNCCVNCGAGMAGVLAWLPSRSFGRQRSSLKSVVWRTCLHWLRRVNSICC